MTIQELYVHIGGLVHRDDFEEHFPNRHIKAFSYAKSWIEACRKQQLLKMSDTIADLKLICAMDLKGMPANIRHTNDIKHVIKFIETHPEHINVLDASVKDVLTLLPQEKRVTLQSAMSNVARKFGIGASIGSWSLGKFLQVAENPQSITVSLQEKNDFQKRTSKFRNTKSATNRWSFTARECRIIEGKPKRLREPKSADTRYDELQKHLSEIAKYDAKKSILHNFTNLSQYSIEQDKDIALLKQNADLQKKEIKHLTSELDKMTKKHDFVKGNLNDQIRSDAEHEKTVSDMTTKLHKTLENVLLAITKKYAELQEISFVMNVVGVLSENSSTATILKALGADFELDV